MKMTIRLSAMATVRKDVRPLPQRNDNGYGGFGYGGDELFLAWIEDCFDPPVWAIRADSIESAYEVVEASLAPVVDADEYGMSDKDLAAALDSGHFTFAPDGSVVDTEAVRVVHVRRPVIGRETPCGFCGGPDGGACGPCQCRGAVNNRARNDRDNAEAGAKVWNARRDAHEADRRAQRVGGMGR